MKREIIEWGKALAIVALLTIFVTSDAMAAIAQIAGPLDKIKDTLTGPVGKAIAVVAIVIAGGTLVFGGELGEFARKAVMVALAIGFILGAVNIVEAMSSGSSTGTSGYVFAG